MELPNDSANAAAELLAPPRRHGRAMTGDVTIPAADLPTIVAALDTLFDARMWPHAWPLARTDETWRKPLYTLYLQATGQLIANTRRAS